MLKFTKTLGLVILGIMVFTSSPALAGPIHDASWDPDPNIFVNSDNPHYFTLDLPAWDMGKDDYTVATFELTYEDQYELDIEIWAAAPAGISYDILLGTVPITVDGASGTETFDLLAVLDAADFNTLFQGQATLFLVADCHYYFDKASLHLEAVPIPTTFLLLGSGLLGLFGLRRGIS